MEILNYPYRPKLWGTLGGFIFFGLITIQFGYAAVTNTSGVRVDGIELDASEATIFYWCLTVGSAAFILLGAASLVAILFREHRAVMTDSYIAAPKTIFNRGPTIVRFSDIKHISLRSVRKIQFLDIQHIGGKLTIAGSLLPKQAVEKLHAELTRRLDPQPAA